MSGKAAIEFRGADGCQCEAKWGAKERLGHFLFCVVPGVAQSERRESPLDGGGRHAAGVIVAVGSDLQARHDVTGSFGVGAGDFVHIQVEGATQGECREEMVIDAIGECGNFAQGRGEEMEPRGLALKVPAGKKDANSEIEGGLSGVDDVGFGNEFLVMAINGEDDLKHPGEAG